MQHRGAAAARHVTPGYRRSRRSRPFTRKRVAAKGQCCVPEVCRRGCRAASAPRPGAREVAVSEMSASGIQAYDYGRGHRQATSTVPYHERGAEAPPALDPLPQAPVSSQPPAAAAPPLITPAAASAASPPPADPSQPVRQAPAGAGAPQARMGMAPQRPPAEAYGAARPDSYGSARTGAYDRPATGSHSQAATPAAPRDRVQGL